jgi:L-lactate dehydrogenase complex protein LldG
VVAITVVSDARAVILGRVRDAVRDVPADEPAAALDVAPPSPAPPAGGLAERFVERVEDYRATVTRCAPDDVAETVAAICERHGARRVAAPAGLDRDWLPAGVEVLADNPPLGVDILDGVDGVVTGSALGIAETGTIVVDGGPTSGRRALSLVPDLHVCVVMAADLVAGVPEAVAAMAAAVGDGRAVTLVSGPSATSDIELDRVEGVHGPRRLEVVLVTPPA